ncbi:MotA/TolQ/ExbB proton channel family protein [bacterium]|nr:MotA/TolQ/ExbB proton channel family protein [bacterium]MBU1636344.1 MotA/TolQ/ExbB proton channel family protein [bacterium]MBU1921311.1 MotA/TolQ/ExbB proton channel family protein [bacterium]
MGAGTGSFWELVAVASPFAKFILLLLVVMSLLSWTIIIDKFLMITRIRKASDGLGNYKWRDFEPRTLFAETRRCSQAFAARAYLYVHRELIERGGRDDLDGELIEHEYSRAAAYHLAKAERFLPFLATCSSAGPFLGLLGTVVGIISAFHRIGIWGSANIAVVAPGIAEALVATALGLFTAIPALVAYNFFANWIRKEGERTEAFGEDLSFSFDRYLMAQNRRAPVRTEASV